jgi:hypothetical protein
MPRSVSLASHTASSLSVLGPARGLLDILRLHQLDIQPGRLQQVEPDPPVVASRLKGDLLDPLGDQVLT